MTASIPVFSGNMLYDIDLYHEKFIDEATLTKTAGNKSIAHFTMPSFRSVVKFIRSYEGMLQKHCKDYVPEKNTNEVTEFVSKENRCWLDLSGDTPYIRHHKEIVGSYNPDDNIELRKVLKDIEHFSCIRAREPRRTIHTDDEIAEIESELKGKISELDFDDNTTGAQYERANKILDEMYAE